MKKLKTTHLLVLGLLLVSAAAFGVMGSGPAPGSGGSGPGWFRSIDSKITAGISGGGMGGDEKLARMEEGYSVRGRAEAAHSPARILPSGVERKVVRNGTLTLEVKDYAKSRETALSIASRYGAEVQEDNSAGGQGHKSGTIVFKLPPERMEALLRDLEPLGRIQSRHVAAQDRTEEYVDLQSRLENARKVEKRLTQLLAFKTNKLSDVLQVEKELERIGAEIEQILGRMKYIDALAALSRLTVCLNEPVQEVSQAVHVLNEIRNACVRALNTFVRTGIALVNFTGFLLAVGIWVVGIGGLGWVLKLGYDRWLKERTPSAP